MLDFNVSLNKSEISMDPKDINDLFFSTATASFSKYNWI